MAQALHKIKFRKEDTVQVIAGKDKKKRGRILKVLRDKNRVLVEGVNIVKKAKRRRSQQDRGGIIEIEAAIHSSNLMIVCKKCGPTRIGYKLADPEVLKNSDKKYTEKKIRICKKCAGEL